MSDIGKHAAGAAPTEAPVKPPESPKGAAKASGSGAPSKAQKQAKKSMSQPSEVGVRPITKQSAPVGAGPKAAGTAGPGAGEPVKSGEAAGREAESSGGKAEPAQSDPAKSVEESTVKTDVSAGAGEAAAPRSERAPVAAPEASQAHPMQDARAAYDRMRAAAEDMSDRFGRNCLNATRGVCGMQTRMFMSAGENARAALEFARDLAHARTAPEIVDAHAAYVRRQIEAFAAQAREMTRFVQDVAQPRD